MCFEVTIICIYKQPETAYFFSGQGPFIDLSQDENLQFRSQLGRFSTYKSLNWMTLDGGLRAYHTTRDVSLQQGLR